MDQPEAEVLVHVSAPATRASDDLFRSLADAYLGFEPREPRQQQEPTVDQASDNAALAIPSMDSYGSFPSFAEGEGEGEEASATRLECLEHIQARWKQRTPTSGRASNRSLLLSADEGTFIGDTQQAFAATESQLVDTLSTTSEEEDADAEDEAIPPCNDETEEWDVTLGAELERSRAPFMPQAESRVEEPPAIPIQSMRQTKAKSAQLAKPSQNTYMHTTHSSTRHSVSAVSIETRTRSQTRSQTRLLSSQQSTVSTELNNKETSRLLPLEDTAHAGHTVNFETLPTTVTPLPENIKVSMKSPDSLPSQVTPYLEKLKRQIPERFQPKDPKTLKLDDRGYWRIDCRPWPQHVQHGFWSALQGDVESGRLGWGITLHRDAASMRLGQVRLYCWGEIAEHVWLSLWLHSGGRVKNTGAVWMDADNKEIMTIP